MRRALIILLLLAIAGGGIAYYLWNKAPESAANKKADYTVTPGELLQAFQTDEEAANAKYLGKVLEVKGTIAEIIPGENMEMQVILDTGDIMSRVSCVMEEDYETFLARKLKSGDTVTVKGFCTGMAMDIVLDRCVVVS